MVETPRIARDDRAMGKAPFCRRCEGSPWIGYIPPAYEPEVAANLRWFADPMDGVEFDSRAPRPVPPLERAVRFAKPGTYRLWALSHPPLDATSNALQVEVVIEKADVSRMHAGRGSL